MMMMMLKSCMPLAVFVSGAIFGLISLSVCHAQGQVQVENFQLSRNVPYDCETVIDTHTFSGTCCSLNSTDGDGCVVNVANGNCVIKGQYFTLDFTSTYDSPCPPSEFEVPGVESPAETPSSDAMSSSSSLLSMQMIVTVTSTYLVVLAALA